MPMESSKRSRPPPAGGGCADKAKPPRAPAKKKATTKKASATTTTTTVTVRGRPKLIWRTRDQENSALYNLQLDVAGLQSELQRLREYREMLMSRVLNRRDDSDGSLVRVVREYFRVFRNGYASDAQLQQRLLTAPTSREGEDIATPDEFLRRVMDEHIAIGRFSGLTHMMKQWARYSSVFGPLTLSFLDSQIISRFQGSGEDHERVLVTSRAQYQLYISLRTLEMMFPHVLPHHELVSKILGRRISGIGKFDFVFDLGRSRIVRYEFSLDLTTSFIDLLGDPAMVALLLNDALISDEFFIGDLSDMAPDAPPVPSLSIMEIEEPEASEQADPGVQEASSSRSWKMTLSSILSAVDGEEDVEGEARDGGGAMDDSEPDADRGPDEHDDHLRVQVRLERV